MIPAEIVKGVCDRRHTGLGDQPGRREKVFTAFDICFDNSSKRSVSSEIFAVSWSVVVVVAIVRSGDNSIMQSDSSADCSRRQESLKKQLLQERCIHCVKLISQ